MFRYLCVRQTLHAEFLGTYTTFGIEAQQCVQGVWQTVAAVPDVAAEQALVERLARLATEGQLDPVQLLDVIEDFI